MKHDRIAAGSPELLFFDADCGLCQRAVRFVQALDPGGARFTPLPIGGEAFCSALSESQRAALPDSIVVLAADGRLLTRSAAVVHILRRIGGFWRLMAGLLWLMPRPVRDAAYDAIARRRRRTCDRSAAADAACRSHATLRQLHK